MTSSAGQRHEGRVGTPLRITLESLVLSCRWGQRQVAAGGTVSLVVSTAYVGDGCPFSFTILDARGAQAGSVQGKSLGNICSACWTVPDNASGRVLFLVEAPSVGIEGRSDALEVIAGTAVGAVEALDVDGAALAAAPIGTIVRWRVRLPGVPAKTACSWAIVCHVDADHAEVVDSGVVEVAGGEAVVDWESRYPAGQESKAHQGELDRTSETYADATFEAVFTCLGATARSARLPARTGVWLLMDSSSTGERSLVLPDGNRRTVEVRPGEVVELEGLSVGVSEFEPAAEGRMGDFR